MIVRNLLEKEFVILDGAVGTEIQKMDVEVGNLPETLNFTHPELIIDLHKKYIEAGADIIYATTFGVNRYRAKDSGYTYVQLIEKAIENAKIATAGTDVLIGLDIGPVGKLLEPNGELPFEEAYEVFKELVIAGKDVDLIVIETMTDLYEMKAALLAAKENSDKPVFCTMSFEENGRTFTGTGIPSMALTLEGLGADAIGFNCSLGPAELYPLVEELAKWTTLPIIVKANAGLPDPKEGKYMVTADEFVDYTEKLIPLGVKIIGGCCGTTPEFIEELSKRFSNKKYEKQCPEIPAAVCTAEKTVVIDRPRIIGERINPTGKKKLKEALKSGDMDYILSQAADQVRDGAQILDVNVGVPGIDEEMVIVKVVKALQGITTTPLQIDSNDPKVIEAALRVYSGKAIVNSVNGEEESLNTILPIVKKYGASVVGLTLDQEGIPKTVRKRVDIARKILDRAIDLGIKKEDVYIDCLTLTVSAEQDNAKNTLEAIAQIKNQLGLKTVLGVSNISFGLPNREIINHNFLQMALTSGLDLPIMNPGAIEMVEAVYVHNLIMNIDKGATEYIFKYKDVVKNHETQAYNSEITLVEMDKLSYAIENGLQKDCKEIIAKELETREPMDIINNTLIPVLDKAGRDFETGISFIPQLMLCASTAQVAFDVIKEKLHSGNKENVSKGKVVIATVKGDIHDIGKNIVKVILENYGFTIIDLGKDVEPEVILESVKKNDVNLLGLSALMTTTLKSMEQTINLVKAEMPNCKIMVGGAVLTDEYAKQINADFYVKDAKQSTDVAKKVLFEEN
ncbi:MAG: homocysteine S-methyltransferase family protein [Anaerovoracaceae bacterium]